MSTILNRGDIAFTSIRSDDGDSFSFVPLVALAAGTQIIFTDNGWLENGTLRSGEGSVTWTTAAAIAAGTTVTLSNPAGGNWPAAQGGSGSFNLSASGDQIIAYQGVVGAPERLLAAVSLNAFLTAPGVAVSSNQSYVPGTGTATTDDDLTVGLYSVQLRNGSTETDNGAYQGQTVGTVEELREVINTAANWTTTDDPALLPAPPAAFTIDSGEGAVVSIGNASVQEGDAGTKTLTFTVTRSDTAGAFTVDFATADGSATAGSDYAATGGTLVFAAGGDASATISVTIAGDTAAEPDETFTVTLSNLLPTAGDAVLGTAVAAGTIVNDDILLTRIGAIQGAGHKAPLVGGAVGSFGNSGSLRVSTEGVVTAITTNGFWIQDGGDGDITTSDGIFVFTSSAPAATIAVGETIRLLDVQVSEFRPGGSGGGNNLTITQLSASTGTVVELGGSTVVAPVVLGTDRILPTAQVEDDGFASFDPATDAIDFWESLEGMLVSVPNPVAVSPTAEFRTRDPNDSANTAAANGNEEIWVRIPGTEGAGTPTPQGGFLLGAADTNPERIQIDDMLVALDLPSVDVGAVLSTVTGIVGYDFANYEVLVTAAPTVVTPSAIAPEATALRAGPRALTIASYNVENLDPKVESTASGAVAGGDLYTRRGESDDDVGSGKYARHASQIALDLGAPTIVALQEVQDNDGAEISAVVAADVTLQTLVDLILANHGVQYAFAVENPAYNADGGQPNANIRNAFLYRADQVTLLGTSRITDANLADGDAFGASRKPLVGEFSYNGVEFTVVNNHFNSKGGDNAIFGNVQPPVLSSEAQRIEQAAIVNAFVDGKLAADAAARVVVLGDLNDFAWSTPNRTLAGIGAEQVLTDLGEALLPEAERYSYNFQGNAQSLDHTLVTDALLGVAAFDIVHVNSEFTDQASDHDPSVARFDFTDFGERLVFSNAAETIDGGAGGDRIFAGGRNDVVAGGAGNDTLVGGGGEDRFVFNPGDGADRINDFEDGADLLDFTGFAGLGVDGIADLRIRTLSNGATYITVEEDPLFSVRLLPAGIVLTDADFIFA